MRRMARAILPKRPCMAGSGPSTVACSGSPIASRKRSTGPAILWFIGVDAAVLRQLLHEVGRQS